MGCGGCRAWIALLLAVSVLQLSSCALPSRSAPSASPDSGSSVSTPESRTSVSTSLPVAVVARLSVGSMTSDEEARKLYGDGLFVKGEGHGGGRYWVDPTHNVTLHAEIGDGSLESIDLAQGVYLPAGLAVGDDPRLVTPALSADPPVDHGLRLGMSAGQLLDKLGPPLRDDKTGVQRTLTYEAPGDESSYQATFLFVADKLRRISVYNGE